MHEYFDDNMTSSANKENGKWAGYQRSFPLILGRKRVVTCVSNGQWQGEKSRLI